MRLVLDGNVLVSALLSRTGAPALLLEHWLDGRFELVVSELLLAELEQTLAVPKLRKRIPEPLAQEFVELLKELAEPAVDPPGHPDVRSKDPGDDYLIALAARERAHLVSGDADLLELAGAIPLLIARAALELLDRQ